MKRIIYIKTFAFVFMHCVLVAQELAVSGTEARNLFIKTHGDLSILGLRIRGLRRTRSYVVLANTSIKIGDPLSSFNPEETVQKLRELNIFHHIAFDYELNGKGVEIIIILREKWTLIPMPAIRFGGECQSYGVFLLETNFLGYKKILYTGGSWSPDRGWIARAGYVDPSIGNSNFVTSTSWTVGDQLIKNFSGEDELIQEFQTFHLAGELTFGYRVYKKHVLSGLTIYRMNRIGSTDNPVDPPSSVDVQYGGMQYRYRNQYFREILAFGWDIRARLARGFPLHGDLSPHLFGNVAASYSFPFFSCQRITFMARGGFGDMPAAFEERIGGSEGFKTLPAGDVGADHYVSGTTTWEYSLWNHHLLTLTSAVFWEQGAFKKDDFPMYQTYGPGAGFRIYLKKVAIPAVGFNLVYSIPREEIIFTGSVGASM